MNKLLTGMYAVLCTLVMTQSTEAQQVERTSLSNGVTVITKPSRANNIVAVEVTLRMGSLYETDEEAGLATFMQDTLLKGTENRTSEEIAFDLESLGTKLSTSAGREYGSVSLMCTSETLYESLAILYDILLNPTFPEDAVELQRIQQERNIRLRNDQPLYRAMDLMVDVHYGEHPFHKPSLGYPETVEGFTREQVAAYHRAVYVPRNMVFSVVGNFDAGEVVADITENVGHMEGGSLPEKVDGEKASYDQPVENVEARETAASWFALGWPSATIDSPDFYAMEVLDSITGGSMNSRLFIAIREQRGLAYQVASFINARREAGIYVAYIGTDPTTYAEAKRVLIDEVHRMAEEPATPEEIDNAKTYLEGMHIMSQESNSGQASRFGMYEIIGVGYEFIDTYTDGIEAVTAEDIREAGRKYLLEPYAMGAVLAGE